MRLVALLLLLAGLALTGPEAAATAQAPGLHVVGNRLVDGQGRTLILRGVNRSGPEYACIQGWGIFDGPSTVASVAAIASWHVNFVRVPLNEDCWLGINHVKPQYAGANYRRAIVRYVQLLHRQGIYVELSLIWAAPGTYRAMYQSGSPDEDHAPAFWRSLARTFRGDHEVILAPWGETIVDARCFLHGGVCEATYGKQNTPYRTAGMQQAVTVMRRAGYRGPIAIPGIDYANDLSKWLSHEPRDPLHQLVAEAHIYGKNTCSTTACFDRTLAPVARRVPLVFGETGETYDASDCGSTNIASFLTWADADDVAGYAAWTWDTWGGCGVLISSYAGTPANDFGRWVQSYYASKASTTYPA
jgi:endoglucanase